MLHFLRYLMLIYFINRALIISWGDDFDPLNLQTLIHFLPMQPFSTPWKQQKTLRFQGVEKGFIGNKKFK